MAGTSTTPVNFGNGTATNKLVYLNSNNAINGVINVGTSNMTGTYDATN